MRRRAPVVQAFDAFLQEATDPFVDGGTRHRGRFGDASAAQLSALLTAGFVLFVITLIVNTLASIIVNRSRSGAGTDA